MPRNEVLTLPRPPAPRRDWPTAERVDLLAEILGDLERRPRRPQLIIGPAGIGKTTLANVIAEQSSSSRQQEPTIAIGVTELRNVPLGAFAPVVARHDLPIDPERAVPALIAHLAGRAAESLLVIDDAPRIDEVSAGVVYNAIRAFGVGCVLTARVEEPLPNALARLLDDGLADVHEVGGLTLPEVDQLLTSHYSGRVRFQDVQRLTERTDGNPMYLRSLIERADRDGAATVEGDSVRISDGATSPSLLASVTDRVAELSSDLSRIVHLVALAQPIAADTVAPGVDGRTAIDALILGGFVIERADRLRLAHPLYAEALDRMVDGPANRIEAAKVLADSGVPADRFRSIRILLDTDHLPGSADLEWAAEYALAAGDPRGAIDLAEEALDLEESFSIHLLLAAAHGMAGHLDDADESFASAARCATGDRDWVLLAARRGEHLAFRRGDGAAAIRQAREVIDRVPDAAAYGLQADLRLWRVQIGDFDDGEPGDPASSTDPRLAARNAAMTVLVASLSGDPDTGAAAEAELQASAAELGMLDPTAAAMLGFNRYIGMLSRGEGAEAHEFLTDRRLQGGPDIGVWSFIAGEHALYNGQLAAADGLASMAVDQLRWRDELGATLVARELQGLVAAQRGEVAEARAIRESQGTYPSMLPTTGQLIAENRAWIAWHDGRPERAAELVLSAAHQARDTGFRFIAAVGTTFAIRLGVTAEAASLLDELCADVPEGLAWYSGLRDLATALRDRRPERVPAAAHLVAKAHLTPTALDGISLALGMHPDGETRRKLERLSAGLRPQVDAPLIQEPPVPVLSARELEVARRAAARHRSREIAEALGISTSTVNNQLQSAYRKLGVASRDELADAMDEAGLLDV